MSDANLTDALGDTTLAQALLAPTTIYVKPLLALFKQIEVKALSHITGGGLLENLPRVLPDNCNARIDTASWDWPAVFHWLQQQGNVQQEEMYRTFNCGVGMVICVAAADAAATIELLQGQGLSAWVIGEITEGTNEVTFRS